MLYSTLAISTSPTAQALEPKQLLNVAIKTLRPGPFSGHAECRYLLAEAVRTRPGLEHALRALVPLMGGA